jgi:hypothetical protein
MAWLPLRLRASNGLSRMLPLLAATCTACHVDIDAIPVGPAPIPADAGALARAEAGAAAPTHAACTEPAPETPPDAPAVASTAAGRPEFDLYRDLDCDELAQIARCDQPDLSDPYACSHCLGASDAPAQAVCVPRARRGCVPVFHGPGCISCVAPEVKARACCLGLDLDCRAWPFDASSGPGQPCARGSDCEPGLLCAAVAGETRFGLCSCPEQAPVLAPALDACLWERQS